MNQLDNCVKSAKDSNSLKATQSKTEKTNKKGTKEMRFSTVLNFVVCVFISTAFAACIHQPIPEPPHNPLGNIKWVKDEFTKRKDYTQTSKPINPSPPLMWIKDKEGNIQLIPQIEPLDGTLMVEDEDGIPRPMMVDGIKRVEIPDGWKRIDNPNDVWETFDTLNTEHDIKNKDFNPLFIDKSNSFSIDLVRNTLIEKYGDIPEVADYMIEWGKQAARHTSIQEKIRYAEAAYALAPHPQTQKAIRVFKAIAENDTASLEQLTELAELEEGEFVEVQRFFLRNNHTEGFRRLRDGDPIRSVQFEKYILALARTDPHIDYDTIARAIEQSHEPPNGKK